MTQKETDVLTTAIGKLNTMFDLETDAIQKARKAAIPSLLKRRDELQDLIRELVSIR